MTMVCSGMKGCRTYYGLGNANMCEKLCKEEETWNRKDIRSRSKGQALDFNHLLRILGTIPHFILFRDLLYLGYIDVHVVHIVECF